MDGALRLQRQIGNHATRRRLTAARPIVQAKLAVSGPNQPDELESDRLADAVAVGEPARARQRAAHATSNVHASAATEARIRGRHGHGARLHAGVRDAAERSLGVDLAQVRVHTDGAAHELSTSLQARAFATGTDIFFRRGEYDPGSRGGRRLIAHELTHVVQQGAAAPAIQRELMSLASFVEDSQSGGLFAKTGAVYTAIKTALGDYHKHKARLNTDGKLRALRTIAARCSAWLHKHAPVSLKKGALEYATDKKGKARLGPILALRAEAEAEYGEVLAADPQHVQQRQRRIVNVYMGQGVAVDLGQYALASSGFLSCSPVVMYNHGTKHAGLFHYAAGSLETQGHQLIELAGAVRPTHIYIYPGGSSMQAVLQDYLENPEEKPSDYNHVVVSPLREYLEGQGDADADDTIRGLEKDKEALVKTAYEASDMRVLHDFLAAAVAPWEGLVSVQNKPMSTIHVHLHDGQLAIGEIDRADIFLRSGKDELERADVRAFTSSATDYTDSTFSDESA